MRDWIRPQDLLPKEGEVVSTMGSSGHVQTLKRQGRLWFVPDGSQQRAQEWLKRDPAFVYFVEGSPQDEREEMAVIVADLLDEAILREAEWWAGSDHAAKFEESDCELVNCYKCKRLAKLQEGKI